MGFRASVATVKLEGSLGNVGGKQALFFPLACDSDGAGTLGQRHLGPSGVTCWAAGPGGLCGCCNYSGRRGLPERPPLPAPEPGAAGMIAQ